MVAKLNKRNIQRYIRLNYLNNYLVKLVDIEDICNGKYDDNETDLTSGPVGQKLSQRNIRRYIRLNYLNNYLVKLVDIGDIEIRPAVDISFLSTEHQDILSRLKI